MALAADALTAGSAAPTALLTGTMRLLAARERALAPTVPALVNELARDALRGHYNDALALAFTKGFVAGPLLAGAAIGRALDIVRARLGPVTPEAPTLHHNPGEITHARGDYAAVAADRAAMAAILDGLGRRGEAKTLLHAAMRTFEHVPGREHHEVACTLTNLAAIAYRRDRTADRRARARRRS